MIDITINTHCSGQSIFVRHRYTASHFDIGNIPYNFLAQHPQHSLSLQQTMYTLITALATGLLASMVSAAPLNDTIERRDDNFNLHVWNNCPWTKEVALYSVSPSFQMEQDSTPVNIPAGGDATIQASFSAIGMRLSGHAEYSFQVSSHTSRPLPY